MFKIDRAHEKMDIFEQKMTKQIWHDKYRYGDERNPNETFMRVANAIMPEDIDACYHALKQGLWLPGGRITAGAGTAKRVTLMNCYVNGTLHDSMEGLMGGVAATALTLQQGGGMGTDFSPLRPEGAILRRTHTKASGPMPFMFMWDATSKTIRSAGDRRGAMMGTMCDTHPDIFKFIHAKNVKGALEQFNMSILVSDALMEAVKEDEDWMLYFHVPPIERKPGCEELDFEDDDNVKQYVYDVFPARHLWDEITQNTYEYSEPGVIFIDRVNALNNLHYCEDIRCTNPCGEQPLPPNGTCNLGHINLSRCVINPFTDDAQIDYKLVQQITKLGVRFLDNVIDVTSYPLPEQETEEKNKRRLGLGDTGLADMLCQLKVRYGSPDAVRITEEVTRVMTFAAYEASCDLAEERGSFPLFDADKYLSGYSFAHTMLPEYIKDRIRKTGIRNSLLMTIAPVGTGSIFYGNVSSGDEPIFLHESKRRVMKATSNFQDEWEYFTEWGYAARLFKQIHGEDTPLPNYMVTTEDLSVDEHIVMQAAAQRYVDASISKTVNIPKDMPYEQFVKVYDLAYSLGCKGCTTYRPSDVRGSILSAPGDDKPTVQEALPTREPVLSGHTYKLNWPTIDSALYLTINHDSEGHPFELFINSKDSRYHDWTTALTTMISAIWRKGGDVGFVASELQQVQALNDGAFKEERHHPSLVAYIGFKLEQHINGKKDFNLADVFVAGAKHSITSSATGDPCPKCKQPTFIRQEGCKKCTTCSYSTCG